jgi:hypothetical protein
MKNGAKFISDLPKSRKIKLVIIASNLHETLVCMGEK